MKKRKRLIKRTEGLTEGKSKLLVYANGSYEYSEGSSLGSAEFALEWSGGLEPGENAFIYYGPNGAIIANVVLPTIKPTQITSGGMFFSPEIDTLINVITAQFEDNDAFYTASIIKQTFAVIIPNQNVDDYASGESAVYGVYRADGTSLPGWPITPTNNIYYYSASIGEGYVYVGSEFDGVQKIDVNGNVVGQNLNVGDAWIVEYRDGFVYVANYNKLTGSIFKLNASDLSIVWEAEVGGAMYIDIDSQGYLYFTHFFANNGEPSYGVIRKLDSSGQEVTTGNFPLPVPNVPENIFDVAVDGDDNLYACSYDNAAPVTKFDSDGNFIWHSDPTKDYNFSDVVIDSLGRPVATDSTRLVAFDPATGDAIWELDRFGVADPYIEDDRFLIYSPSADTEGNTYWTAQYTSDDYWTFGWVVAKINSDGELVWESILIDSSLEADSNNYFYSTATGALQ